MPFEPDLSPGQVIDNDQLCAIFGCSPQGGMRRSKTTGTLVLISNHVKSIYDDRWIGDQFHYTGMGTTGDQSLSFMQNKVLAESSSNGVDLHLFEVHREQQYTYCGRVQLAGSPYQETQPDQAGDRRKVWVFPLRVINGQVPPLPEDDFREVQSRRESQARGLSDEELLKRAIEAYPDVGQREVTTTVRERSAYIAEYAKRRAQGCCELCAQPAPFKDRNGRLYLETHHIVWLAHGGSDSIQNTVALCPNCHRKMHVLDLEADRDRLLEVAGRMY